ncbi:MAG: hypothetical protein ACTSRL_03965 [Candidatus Helarchaeota archaeon]
MRVRTGLFSGVQPEDVTAIEETGGLVDPIHPFTDRIVGLVDDINNLDLEFQELRDIEKEFPERRIEELLAGWTLAGGKEEEHIPFRRTEVRFMSPLYGRWEAELIIEARFQRHLLALSSTGDEYV